MKALFLRDLRRLARWGWAPPLLALVLMSFRGFMGGPLDLLHGSIQDTTLVLFPLYAFVVGLAASWLERRGGPREVLLQRPTAPRELALARWAAAAVIYVVGVLPPSLAMVAWLRLPAHFHAPFRWEMTWPLVVDVLVGLLGVSAGLLVAQRDVRWQGTRLLPLACVMTTAAVAFHMPTATGALLVALLPQPFLVVAALGSLETGADVTRLTVLDRWVLGLTLSGGVLGILATANLLFPLHSHDIEGRRVDHRLGVDGSILRMAHSGEPGTSFYDRLDWEGVAAPQGISRTRYFELRAEGPWSPVGQPELAKHESYRSRSHFSTRVFDGEEEQRSWFLHDRGIVESYSRVDGRLLARQGVDGLATPDEPVPSPWPGRLLRVSGRGSTRIFATTEFLGFRHRNERHYTPLLTRADGGLLDRVHVWDEGDQRVFLVLQGPRLRIFDWQGHSLFDRELPTRGEKSPSHFRLHRQADGGWVTHTVWRVEDELQDHFQKWTREGVPTDVFLAAIEQNRVVRTGANIAAGLLTPPALRWAWPTSVSASYERAARLVSATAAGPHRLAASLVSALLCSLIGLAIARRDEATRGTLLSWVLIPLLLGPAGLLVLLGLRPLSCRREPCDCGEVRREDQPTCAACGAPWPEPDDDGRRLFLPMGQDDLARSD